MSLLTVLSENLLLADGVEFSMYSGTENANFPLTNIQKNFTTKVFRSNENPCEILIDLKQTRDMDIISLTGHTLEGLGITSLKVSFSATTDFTGLDELDVDLNHLYNFGYLRFDSISTRYVKLTLENTGEYCELSNIFIGKSIDFMYNGFAQDSFQFGYKDFSNRSSNEYGQDFINVRNQTKTILGSFKFANKEEVDYLDYIISGHINGTPLWLIIDECDCIINDATFRLSGFYRFNNRPKFKASGPGLFDVSLTFQGVV